MIGQKRFLFFQVNDNDILNLFIRHIDLAKDLITIKKNCHKVGFFFFLKRSFHSLFQLLKYLFIERNTVRY